MEVQQIVKKSFENMQAATDMFAAKRAVYDACLHFSIEGAVNPKLCTRLPVRVLLLCNPCHGLGDVVFARKIQRYVVEWYGVVPDIATTAPELFAMIGHDAKTSLFVLSSSRGKQCRRFARLSATPEIGKYDIILVAPLSQDHDVSFADVNALVGCSSPSNTYFFSEYNDRLSKNFDVHTGIGGKRDGLLFTSDETSKADITPFRLGVYALVYIAEGITNAELCFLRFLQMITEKYQGDLDTVVCPSWVANIPLRKFQAFAKMHSISINTRRHVTGELVLRCDVFPVSARVMRSLMRFSVPDILLTGDQSITDALSCCASTKNIFYQIAPWKESFARHLAKYIPNEFIRLKKTSCGTREALFRRFDAQQFVLDWDFRVLGKSKLDAMVLAAILTKYNAYIKAFVETTNTKGARLKTVVNRIPAPQSTIARVPGARGRRVENPT